ncbi:hypothetical protein QR680_009873 [Steinernema hermaphroditum]|uniref:G-protein coupled receptors family 2 profile 2 domain-containing protein n=1 Tax=Steinernema hermaphroditum TaxID=289476 RepID=A0AA39ILY0_9BILA|nr:hypothetical protein QR680_009873 [Steinernema hermaphroditum]
MVPFYGLVPTATIIGFDRETLVLRPAYLHRTYLLGNTDARLRRPFLGVDGGVPPLACISFSDVTRRRSKRVTGRHFVRSVVAGPATIRIYFAFGEGAAAAIGARNHVRENSAPRSAFENDLGCCDFAISLSFGPSLSCFQVLLPQGGPILDDYRLLGTPQLRNMDLKSLYLSLLVLIFASASDPITNDDLSFEYAEDIAKTSSPVAESAVAEKFLREHAKCSKTDWACQAHCNRKFYRPKKSHCRMPHTDDHCFGVAIRYNYTFEEGGFDRFPSEYEVLKRFPRCWTALAPLICASTYRPCSVRSYYMAGFDELSTIELWEVLPLQSCIKAREECATVVRMGYWPEFLNCDDRVRGNGSVAGPRGLFDASGECKTPYNEAPSQMPREQCIWPLVNSTSTDHSVIADGCHMPCKTPLATQGGVVLFMLVTFLFGGLMMVLLFFAATWLYWVSQAFIQSHIVFALTNLFFSGFLYFLVLLCGFLPFFSVYTHCTDGGRLRNEPNREVSFCSAQAFGMHFAILAGYNWAAYFVVLVVFRKIQFRWSRLAENDLRTPMCALFYGSALLCALGSAMSYQADIDGATNICFVGLRNITKTYLLYGPMTIATGVAIMASVVGCILTSKENKGLENEEIDDDDVLLPRVNGDLARIEAQAKGLDPFEMPYMWIAVIVCSIVMSLIGSAMTHALMTVAHDTERTEILSSVMCSLNETFTTFDPKWAIHPSYKSPETDPFVRKDALAGRVTSSSKCALNTGLYTQHILATFFSIVFFPSLFMLVALYFFKQGYNSQYSFSDLKTFREGSTLGPWWDNLSCFCFSKGGYTAGKSQDIVMLSEVKKKDDLEEAEEGLVVRGEATPLENKRMLAEMSDGELPSASVSRPFGSTEQLNHSARLRDFESGFETEPVTSSGDLKVKLKNDEAHERFREEMEKQKRAIESSSDGEGALTSVSQREAQDLLVNTQDILQIVANDERLYNRAEMEGIIGTRLQEIVQRCLAMGCDHGTMMRELQDAAFICKLAGGLPPPKRVQQAPAPEQVPVPSQPEVSQGALPEDIRPPQEDTQASDEEGSLEPIPEECEESEQRPAPPQNVYPMVVMSGEEFIVESRVDDEEAIMNPFVLARTLAAHEDFFGTPANLRTLRHFNNPAVDPNNPNLLRSVSGHLYEFQPNFVPFYFPDDNAYFSMASEEDLLDHGRYIEKKYKEILEECETPADRYRRFFEHLHSDGLIYRYDMSEPQDIAYAEYAQMLAQETAELNKGLGPIDALPAGMMKQSLVSLEDPDQPTCSRYVRHQAPLQQNSQPPSPTPEPFNGLARNSDHGSEDWGSIDLHDPNLPELLGLINAPLEDGPVEDHQGKEEVPQGPRTFFHDLQQRPDRLFGFSEETLDDTYYNERLQEFLRSYDTIRHQIPPLDEIFRQNPDWDEQQREQYAQLYDPVNMFRAAEEAEARAEGRSQGREGPVEMFNRRENTKIGIAWTRPKKDIRQQFAEAIWKEVHSLENPVEEALAEAEDAEDPEQSDDFDEDEEEVEQEEETSADEGVASESSSTAEEHPPSPPHPSPPRP